MAKRTLTSGLRLTLGWPEGSDHWGDEMDDDLRKISAIAQLVVLSMTTPLGADDSNSAFASPGDIYIFPVSDSNSFQDSNSNPHHGYVCVNDEDGWHYYQPEIGWVAYVVDLAGYYKYTGSGVWAVLTESAVNILYDSGDHGDSNSTQTTVAGALDDIYKRIRDITAGAIDASTVAYDSGDTGDSNSTATSVQEALDDLYGLVRDVAGGTVSADTVTYDASGPDSNSGEGATTVQIALDYLLSRDRSKFKPIAGDHTIVAADENAFLAFSDSSNSGATMHAFISHDDLYAAPLGFTFSVVQMEDQQVTITVEDDSNSAGQTLLLFPSDMTPTTRTKFSVISATKKAADVWLVYGDLDPA